MSINYILKLIDAFRISNTFDDIIDPEERIKTGIRSLIGYQLIDHFNVPFNYKILVIYNSSRDTRDDPPKSITIYKRNKIHDKKLLVITDLKSLSPLWKVFTEIQESRIGWETNRKIYNIYNIYKDLKVWNP